MQSKNEEAKVNIRDPFKVNYFTPYMSGDCVMLQDKQWQVQQGMKGWYLTDTGNHRGTHPTVKDITGMNDFIWAIERSAQKTKPDEEKFENILPKNKQSTPSM